MTLSDRIKASGVYEWGLTDIVIFHLITLFYSFPQFAFTVLNYATPASELPFLEIHSTAETVSWYLTGVHFIIVLFTIAHHRYMVYPRSIRSRDFQFKRGVEIYKLTLYTLTLLLPWCAFQALFRNWSSRVVAVACSLLVDAVLYVYQPAVMGIPQETMSSAFMFVFSFFADECRRPLEIKQDRVVLGSIF